MFADELCGSPLNSFDLSNFCFRIRISDDAPMWRSVATYKHFLRQDRAVTKVLFIWALHNFHKRSSEIISLRLSVEFVHRNVEIYGENALLY